MLIQSYPEDLVNLISFGFVTEIKSLEIGGYTVAERFVGYEVGETSGAAFIVKRHDYSVNAMTDL